jgi:hypothetical protein
VQRSLWDGDDPKGKIMLKQDEVAAAQMILQSVSVAAASVSAVLWFLSAGVSYPDVLRGSAPIGGGASVFTGPLLAAVRKSGRLNRWAAIATGIVAALQGASMLVGLLAAK